MYLVFEKLVCVNAIFYYYLVWQWYRNNMPYPPYFYINMNQKPELLTENIT